MHSLKTDSLLLLIANKGIKISAVLTNELISHVTSLSQSQYCMSLTERVISNLTKLYKTGGYLIH